MITLSQKYCVNKWIFIFKQVTSISQCRCYQIWILHIKQENVIWSIFDITHTNTHARPLVQCPGDCNDHEKLQRQLQHNIVPGCHSNNPFTVATVTAVLSCISMIVNGMVYTVV